jgi:nucleotide-binding universal stress UspA family protein
MKKFKIERILIPTDFSETGRLAIEHGAFMARLFKAELFLLHILEVNEYTYDIPEPILRLTNLEAVQGIAVKKLAEIAEGIRKEYGITPTTMSSTGKIASEIVTYADENKIDIIVMGTHGASGFEEYFIGSNAHKVVTRAHCPVITIQTEAKKLGFTDIVVPIDNKFHSREKINYAVELASRYSSRIHILGLLESHEDHDEEKFNIKLDAVEEVVKKAGLPYTRKSVEGTNLAVSAMEYSKIINADLIVINTDQESALTGMFMGPFAKQIVNHSRIPVISVKPSEGEFDSINLGGNARVY